MGAAATGQGRAVDYDVGAAGGCGEAVGVAVLDAAVDYGCAGFCGGCAWDVAFLIVLGSIRNGLEERGWARRGSRGVGRLLQRRHWRGG